MFTVAGDDPETFFPVRVAFVGQVRGISRRFPSLPMIVVQGSLAGIGVASVKLLEGDEPAFSVDSVLTADGYFVV
jgi:hypothetical protein